MLGFVVMLHDVRSLRAPEIDAFHGHIEVRTPSLRVGYHWGRNVASDYALLQRVAPFIHLAQRPEIIILLDGQGRFDEDGRRAWLEHGQLVVSNTGRLGTKAFAASELRALVIHWDPGMFGVSVDAPFVVDRLRKSDLRRIAIAASSLSSAQAGEAVGDIVAVLRSVGIPFERVSPRDITHGPDEWERNLYSAVCELLSKLDTRPTIEELVTPLQMNQRQFHRLFERIARRYQLPWTHWRGALPHTRMLQALRLLYAPGATTELCAGTFEIVPYAIATSLTSQGNSILPCATTAQGRLLFRLLLPKACGCDLHRRNVARMTIGFASKCPRTVGWDLAMRDFGFRVRQWPHGSAGACVPSSPSRSSARTSNNC
jgi:hypothetical protein